MGPEGCNGRNHRDMDPCAIMIRLFLADLIAGTLNVYGKLDDRITNGLSMGAEAPGGHLGPPPPSHGWAARRVLRCGCDALERRVRSEAVGTR